MTEKGDLWRLRGGLRAIATSKCTSCLAACCCLVPCSSGKQAKQRGRSQKIRLRSKQV